METRRPIQGLGEIALRVNDLDAMQRFYSDVIGLELMRRFPRSAFLKALRASRATPKYWPCLTVELVCYAPVVTG